jgi:hypothetical protein
MTKYRVDFYKVSFNKETQSTTTTHLGFTTINDLCTSWDMPLARKAALNAPDGCKMWDKMQFTRVS